MASSRRFFSIGVTHSELGGGDVMFTARSQSGEKAVVGHLLLRRDFDEDGVDFLTPERAEAFFSGAGVGTALYRAAGTFAGTTSRSVAVTTRTRTAKRCGTRWK